MNLFTAAESFEQTNDFWRRLFKAINRHTAAKLGDDEHPPRFVLSHDQPLSLVVQAYTCTTNITVSLGTKQASD